MADTTPSWMRWPPNCCETCVSWSKDRDFDYVGMCSNPISMDSGERTDSRYRCPCFVRKDGGRHE
jgi:hypothetical protein